MCARLSGDAGIAGPRVIVSPGAGRGAGWADELPLPPQPVDDLHLDLTQLAFAEPLFLLRLSALLDRYGSTPLGLVVDAPEDRQVANYMSRMQVVTSPDGPLQLPLVRARNRRDVLVPVRRIADEHSLEQLTTDLRGLLDAHLPASLHELSHAIWTAVVELCDNAVTHGTNPHGAYAAVQCYGADRCVLAVGDLGIGIPAHIRRREADLRNDGVAIARATEQGATGTFEERGNGYAGLLRAISRTSVADAHLRIWSGSGQHVIRVADGRNRQQTRASRSNTAGTWISLELRNR